MGGFKPAPPGLLPIMATTASRWSVGHQVNASASTWSSTAWPAANRAIYYPLYVPSPGAQVLKCFWFNGTVVSGNVDFALYQEAGARVFSVRNDKGSDLAQAGTSVLQEYNINDVFVAGGTYYMALAIDNTTATGFRTAINATLGKAAAMAVQNTAYPLPDPIGTLAVYGGGFVFMVGVSLRVLAA